MNRYRIVALVTWLPAAVSPGWLTAQTPASPPSLVEARLQQLKSDSYLRVAVVGDGTIAGRLSDRGAGSFSLAMDSGSRTLRVDQVEALWVRGRATRTGAVVGGIVGVVSGVLFGLWVEKTFYEGVDPNYAGAAARGGVIFGAAGLALGAVIGTAIPKWHQKYP
jgi:hypothetical protein